MPLRSLVVALAASAAAVATAVDFRPPADFNHRGVLDLLDKYETHDFHATEHGRHLLGVEKLDALFQRFGASDDERMEYPLRVGGKDFDLIFRKQKDLFHEDFKIYELDPQTGKKREMPGTEAHGDKFRNCHFSVYVKGDDESRGHAQMCGHGLRGGFVTDGEEFSIQPIDAEGREHVVYNHRDLKAVEEAGSCGLGLEKHVGHAHHDERRLTSNDDDARSPEFHKKIRVANSLELRRRRDLHEIDPSNPQLSPEQLDAAHSKYKRVQARRRQLERHEAMKHPVDDAVRPEHSNSHWKRRRELLYGNVQKVVGVGVLSDYPRYQRWGDATFAHSTSLMNGVDALYSSFVSANPVAGGDGLDSYTIKIQVVSMTALTNTDAAALVDYSADGCSGASSPAANEIKSCAALNAFETYVLDDMLPEPNNLDGVDIGHWLMEQDFESSVVGLANTASACEISGSFPKASITQATSTSDGQIISTIAHELGHNLGFQHVDENSWVDAPSPTSRIDGTNCGGSAVLSDKIMDWQGSSYPKTAWSVCSRRDFELFVESAFYTAGPNCLENAVEGWNVAGAGICGDGVVTGDEQCDCLQTDQTGVADPCSGVDPCCDGLTCKLKNGEPCALLDPCCQAAPTPSPNSCAFVAADTVCRASVDADCDPAERCSGESPLCPRDEFTQTGVACTSTDNENEGTCFLKQCVSHAEQCHNYSPSYPDGAASTSTPSGGNDACDVLKCAVPPSSLSTLPTRAQDGVKCQDGKACHQGACVAFAEVPLPATYNCSNGVLDQDETDVDCGGDACFACFAGLTEASRCVVDADCMYPSTCDLETDPLERLYPPVGVNQTMTVHGTCTDIPTERGKICPWEWCPQWLEDFLQWVVDNYVIVAPVGGTLLFLCCLYCMFKGNKRDKSAGNRQGRAQGNHNEVYRDGTYEDGNMPMASYA